jgi:hypothetical protein
MFIKRVLYANGVQAVVGVMDDYLLLHSDYRTCFVMLAVSVALLGDLGFVVNQSQAGQDCSAGSCSEVCGCGHQLC